METIEEIGVEARELFLENGGEKFTLVPCLNDGEDWAKLVAEWGRQELKGGLNGPQITRVITS
ncbi:MAG: ferrochelatase [Owenweeksia sp.]|nr:ferrochelatase [Owenweeksia sp.]